MPRARSASSTSTILPCKSHGDRLRFLLRHVEHRERLVQRLRLYVEVAGLQAHGDAARAALHCQHAEARHGRGQRLCAAHAAEPRRQDPLAGDSIAEIAAAHFGEGLIGALHDALAADVDPRTGGHLAEHREPLAVELLKVLPGGPVRHQIGVGDEHARRVRVGREHADGLAGLHQQGFALR